VDDVVVIFKVVKSYLHVIFGSILALWLYRDTVNKMNIGEKLGYCSASAFIGVYGGNGLNEWFIIEKASDKAHLVSVLVAIFGLALLALCKEQIPLMFASLRKKWFGE
jgi:hypothetical protein